MGTQLTRREFLGTGLGAVTVFGFSLVEMPGLTQACQGAEPNTVAEIPVIWLATGACSGCSVSLLNTASPTIQELLLGQVLPGSHVSLAFHSTVMAGQGEPAVAAMQRVAHEHKGGYVLIVDGTTSAKDDGLYCGIGEIDGHEITGYSQVRDLGRDAMAVLAVGTCAGYGGIPASGANPTGCMSVRDVFELENVTTPLVNLPGCPPHPDWIVGTIATLLLGGVEALELDAQLRPAPCFERCVHDQCHLRGHFERGEFAEHFGEPGCLLKLGCKGPITYADCPVRKFNNGTSWCCEAGHPCIGCCHPDFPFEGSLFAPVKPAEYGYPEIFAAAGKSKETSMDPYVTVGLIGAGAFAAGVGVTAAVSRLRADQEAEDDEIANGTHEEVRDAGD